MSSQNGVWFTAAQLRKFLNEAREGRNIREVVARKIDGKIFIWAGIPTGKRKKDLESGRKSFHRMGFPYVRLIDGEFYISN